MGKLSRAIAGGVGAGLQQFGQSLMAKHMQEQKDKRTDERLAKEDAFTNRKLEIMEEEAAQRKRAADVQAEFDDMRLGHAKLADKFSDPNLPIEGQLKAASDHFPDGRVYSNNPGKIPMYTTKEGDVPYMVMDIGMPEMDEATGLAKTDPVTGKPKIIPSPLGPTVFRTRDEFENWKGGLANGPAFAAMHMQKWTAKTKLAQEVKLAEAMAKTTVGKQALADAHAGTAFKEEGAELRKAQTAKVKKETEQMKPGGGALSKIKQQGMNQFAKSLTGEYGVAVSVGQAEKITAIYDDNVTREKFQAVLSEAVDPKNTEVTRSDFIASGVQRGLPKEFLEDTFSKAQASFEEAEADFGSDKWFGKFLGGLFSFLDSE